MCFGDGNYTDFLKANFDLFYFRKFDLAYLDSLPAFERTFYLMLMQQQIEKEIAEAKKS